MARVAHLSWPGYLLLAALTASCVGVIGGLVRAAAAGTGGAPFGVVLALALVAGFAYGRAEIRTFFRQGGGLGQFWNDA